MSSYSVDIICISDCHWPNQGNIYIANEKKHVYVLELQLEGRGK